MRKVELLPTRDCEAGYGPALTGFKYNIVICAILVKLTFFLKSEMADFILHVVIKKLILKK